MEDKKNLPQQYINTPFAYTKFSKNLTLLQQSMLVKVSEYLQDHVKAYFGSYLSKSRDIPRPLFSEAEKNSGIHPIMVSYAELGVSINNYSVAHEAVKEVLALTVDAPGEDENGKASIIKYNIFTAGNMSSDMSNGVVFSLNPKVVDYVFDMSQGYVTHPADIARIGQVERMPMMYYYLFKKSARWKERVVRLTVKEIKEYLGMFKVVTEADIVDAESTDADGRKKKSRGRPMETLKVGDIKEAYPKFSKFNSFVLAKSIDDINRLKQEGLLDICVGYEPIYNGKRKIGNPAFIKFHIYDTIEEMQKSSVVEEQLSMDFDVCAGEGANTWDTFRQSYKGKYAYLLEGFEFVEWTDSVVTLRATEALVEVFQQKIQEGTKEENEMMQQAFFEAFGTGVCVRYLKK